MELTALHEFARRYTIVWNSQDPQKVAGFFAAQGSLRVNEDPPAVGRQAIAEVARGFMTTFPDMELVMNKLVHEPDRTEFHWTLKGTNSGPGGTGKRVRMSGYEVWQLDADGLIAESKGNFDSAEYQRQLEHGVED